MLAGMETRMCCFQLKKLLKNNCKYVPCEQLQSYIDKFQAAGGCSTASNCVDLREFVGLTVAPGFRGHCEIVAHTTGYSSDKTQLRLRCFAVH